MAKCADAAYTPGRRPAALEDVDSKTVKEIMTLRALSSVGQTVSPCDLGNFEKSYCSTPSQIHNESGSAESAAATRDGASPATRPPRSCDSHDDNIAQSVGKGSLRRLRLGSLSSGRNTVIRHLSDMSRHLQRRNGQGKPVLTPPFSASCPDLNRFSQRRKQILSGRAALGTVVQENSSSFKMLLALETSLHDMLSDAEISSGTLNRQELCQEDFSYAKKVRGCLRSQTCLLVP
jgi:hypothetical protein